VSDVPLGRAVNGSLGTVKLSPRLAESADDNSAPSYRGYRFPPEIISNAVWLYHRFCLSFRDVEDLLAERGITVSYETIRHWCRKFGTEYARRLKRREGRLGDRCYLDELFVNIQRPASVSVAGRRPGRRCN